MPQKPVRKIGEVLGLACLIERLLPKNRLREICGFLSKLTLHHAQTGSSKRSFQTAYAKPIGEPDIRGFRKAT